MKKQKKKIISLLMVVMLLVNLFSPYSILLSESQAASGTVPDPVVVFNKIQNIIEKNGNKYFKVQIAVVGDVNLNGIDVQFGFDQTKIEPANKVSGKPTTSIGMISEVYPDMADGSYATKTYTNGTFRIKYAKGGGHDLPALDYSAGAGWEDIYAGYDTWAADFDYYLPIITYTFRLVDTSLTDKDITADLFSLKPIPYSLPTGAQIVYFNEKGVDLAYDINSLVGTGFAKPDKTVESISITTNPTKTEYIHGENISLEGGVISVTYTDKTTENISMTDPGVSITSGTPADVNNPIVKVTYANKEASFAITVNDPIQSINVKTPMQKVEYQHGDNLDFSGLEIEATKKSGAKEILTQNTSGLTISEKIASVTSNNFTQTSPEGEIPAKGTQKIIFTYEGKTTYQTIVANDTISNIELKTQPTKTVYKRGEDLDLSGSSIQINLGSGTSTIINLPDGNVVVSNYNPNTIGTKQHLTVKFGEKTATNTIDVEAYDYIVSSELTDPSKYRYNLNENLDVSDGSLKLVWHSGNITNENLSENMVTGFDNTKPGTQTLTITYKPVYTLSDGKQITDTITKTFEIEVVNAISSITITPPTKTTYNHGDNLDLTGGEIVVTYQDKTISNVKIAESMISESDGSPVNMRPASYDSTNKLNKVLKIKYTEDIVTKEAEYPITIVNDVRSIKMHTTPKTQYNVNDVIELTGGEILVTRAVGVPEVVSLTDVKVKVTGFDSKTEHTDLPLTVTYTENDIEKTTTYNINVKDTVKSISIKTEPTKKNYKYNEPLEVEGGTITVTKGSGTEEIPLTDDMISGYDPTKLGDQTVTVTYGGQTTTFVVNVKDYVTKITVKPNTITGKYNDELSKLITDNSITYTVTYAKAGDKTPETLVESMVTGYNKTNINAQTLTVTYTDNDTESYTKGTEFTADLTVTLENEVTKVEITKPTKDTYNHAEELNLESGTITITYANGKTEQEPITSATITEENGAQVNMSPESYDYTNKLSKTLKITYTKDEKTGTVDYPITIINDVKSIAINTEPKKNYQVNDGLDLTIGDIIVTRAVGTEIVSLNSNKVKVTGFDSKTEHKDLPLAVEFTENGITKQTSYNVNVTDNILSLAIQNTPKTQYKYGESLDVSTGTIKIEKSSGPKIIPITENMVTELDGKPFDGTKLGTRNLKVTYGGKTVTYEITVSDYVTGIILTPPTKQTYEYGESLNLDGGSVQKVMASGASTTPVELNDSQVTLSKFDPNKEGAQTIEVTYEGFTQSFGVIVEDNIKTISISKTPKTNYKYGENLDVTGGEILVTKTSGKTQNIPLTTSMVTGYEPNKLGNQELTVTYKNKQTKYTVNVKDYVKDIQIVKPTKLIYKIGESIDLRGGTVQTVMASGIATTPIAMSNQAVTIQGFDSSTEGAKEIKVTYEGFTKTFGITVVDELTGMVIVTLPNKLEYKYGENLDLTGGTVALVKQTGTQKPVNITKDMVTGYNPNKLGNQTLTITYEGFTQEFIVNVKDYISTLKVVAPNKTQYEYGEDIDLTGATVSIIMASGKVEEKTDMTASMISGFNSKQEGKQVITVKYKGLQGNFQVTVTDKVKGISMNTNPNKVEYEYGENLDITGATITVVKSSGITTIPVTQDMVSGYKPNTPGTQLITVTHEGFTTNFVVTVAEKEPEKPIDPEKPQEPQEPQNPEKPTDKPTDNKPNNNNDKPIENKPNNKPTNNNTTNNQNNSTNNNINTNDSNDNEENTSNNQNNNEQEQSENQKPTGTLGVKDEQKDTTIYGKVAAGVISTLGIIFLLILIFFRRNNVKIYVEENGEFVLGGTDRLTKKKLQLDINKYLDGDTYPNKVKIYLKDSISQKLDGKEIEIKHRENTIKHKIKYDNKPYEINLK